MLSMGHDHGGSVATAWASWALMAVAMMAPTAVPMLRSLADILRGRHPGRWWIFLGAYLVVWQVVAVGGALVQALLAATGLDHGRTSSFVTVGVLALAGAYQFTSLKQQCLTACNAPMQWFLAHWRDGVGGAFSMGIRQGATCVGCCWALMALALVGGAASWWLMAVLTVVMLAEKIETGTRLSRLVGVALLVASAVVAVASLTSTTAPSHHHHNTAPLQEEPV